MSFRSRDVIGRKIVAVDLLFDGDPIIEDEL
jgi:hypothetical protein